MNLFQLPWKPTADSPDTAVLIFASRFDSRSFRSAAQLLRLSSGIRSAALRADGCYGAGLMAHPVKGHYYTLSVWRDEATLGDFAHHGVHRDAVKSMHVTGHVDGVLISWWQDAQAPRPSWNDVIARTAASPTGQYRGPDNTREGLSVGA